MTKKKAPAPPPTPKPSDSVLDWLKALWALYDNRPEEMREDDDEKVMKRAFYDLTTRFEDAMLTGPYSEERPKTKAFLDAKWDCPVCGHENKTSFWLEELADDETCNRCGSAISLDVM